jgi:hypothetical protein
MTRHGPQTHATACHATPVPGEAPDHRRGALRLINHLGMDMGSKHAVFDGVRWDACSRSWWRLRTMHPGATAPEEEEG